MREAVLTGQTTTQGGGWARRGQPGHRHLGKQRDTSILLALKSTGKEVSHARSTCLGHRIKMEKEFSSSLRQGEPVCSSLLNVSSISALGVGLRVRGGQLLAGQSLP